MFFVMMLLLVGSGCSLQLIILSQLSGNVANYPLLVAAVEAERKADAQTIVVSHGDSIFGSDVAFDSTSRILNNIPAMVQLVELGVSIISFGQSDLFIDLQQAASLFRGWGGTIVSANVRSKDFNLAPCKITYNVAVCGVLTLSVQTGLGPAIVTAINTTGTDFSDLIAARNEAAVNGASIFVALLDTRLSSVNQISAYIAEVAPYFDIIGLTLGEAVAYSMIVNGSLVVSSAPFGTGYVRVALPGGNMSQVSVTPALVAPSQRAILELQLWRGSGMSTLSIPSVKLSARLVGTSASDSSNRLRYKKLGENPVVVLVADAMRSYANVSISVINTGAVQSDMPTSFVPAADLNLQRSKPLYDLVAGDCENILPFANILVVKNASSSDLCRIANWCATGDDTFSAIAKGLQGYIRGMNLVASYYPDGTAALSSFTWPNGTSVDCNLTTDLHPVALSSFILSGGSNFPQFPSWASTVVTDPVLGKVVCSHLKKVGASGAMLTLEDQLPFDTVVVREEAVCLPSYTLTVLPGFNVTCVSGLPSPRCLGTIRAHSVHFRKFSRKLAALTTISSILSPPNDYSSVLSAASSSVIVGQVVGYGLNLTLSVPNSTGASGNEYFRVCLPEAVSVPVFSRFVSPGIAVARAGGGSFRFWSSATYTPQESGMWGTYCANLSLPRNELLLVVPVRVLQFSTSFTTTEQAFLFLFGVLYLAVAACCTVLLVRQVIVAHIEKTKMFDLLVIVRLDVILLGLLRGFYFTMIGFGVFSANVLSSYFLFEFPFMLDFSIFCCFILLFFSVFQRPGHRRATFTLWHGLLVLNLGLFCFFFVVLITYSLTSGTASSQAVVLAYRITLAGVAIIAVAFFGAYSAKLLNAVYVGRGYDLAPVWLPHMTRLAVVSIVCSAGVLSIFIVTLYSAVQPVVDPVLSSTPWLICFLLLAEVVPMTFILLASAFSSRGAAQKELSARTTISQSSLKGLATVNSGETNLEL